MDSYAVISKCLSEAQAQLNKIKCYDQSIKLRLDYKNYEYLNGAFIENAEGDRGQVHRKTVAESPERFVEYLLYDAVKGFAFAYECKHRRPFEDNRRQVNEIIEKCYQCFDKAYEYELLTNLTDNIHIYFDLLDYYVNVSKEILQTKALSGELKARVQFLAEKGYARTGGGIYDVAFSFDLVRFHISKIVEQYPEWEEKYYRHENQYQRLMELEKESPQDPKKYYRLGRWDEEVFAEAERILQLRTVTRGASKSEISKRETDDFAFGNPEDNKGEESRLCAIYTLICRIHTKRNVEADVALLVQLEQAADAKVFEEQLEELFVSDRYGVFRWGEYGDCREVAGKQLGI